MCRLETLLKFLDSDKVRKDGLVNFKKPIVIGLRKAKKKEPGGIFTNDFWKAVELVSGIVGSFVPGGSVVTSGFSKLMQKGFPILMGAFGLLKSVENAYNNN